MLSNQQSASFVFFRCGKTVRQQPTYASVPLSFAHDRIKEQRVLNPYVCYVFSNQIFIR